VDIPGVSGPGLAIIDVSALGHVTQTPRCRYGRLLRIRSSAPLSQSPWTNTRAGWIGTAGSPTAWATRMTSVLGEANHQGRLPAERTRIGRIPLHVINEVGYIPFDGEAANVYF